MRHISKYNKKATITNQLLFKTFYIYPYLTLSMFGQYLVNSASTSALLISVMPFYCMLKFPLLESTDFTIPTSGGVYL